MSEHDEQSIFFEWLAWQSKFYPELEMFHAIPNGAKLPYGKTRSGKRYSKEANWLIKEGLKAGVPDTCLPVPKRGYHGMYIEFKYGSNKPTKNQLKWLKLLTDQNYYVVICYGFEEAKKHTLWYMEMEERF